MKGFVYVIWNQKLMEAKIGQAKYPSQRLKSLQTGNSAKLTIVCRIPTDNMDKTEKELHRDYSHRKIHGEWFKLTWEDLATIRAMAFQ